MPVSGVVLVLSDEVAARDAALETLAGEPGLTLGERMDDRLPVVAETASTPACTALLERLAAIEGVRAVLPVFHDFTDEPGDDQEEHFNGAS